MKLAQTILSRRDSLKTARRFNAGNGSPCASPAGARVCDPQQLRTAESVRTNVGGLDYSGIAAGHRPALRMKKAQD